MSQWINFFHKHSDRVYLFALFFFVTALPLSNAAISLAILPLALSWFFSGNLHVKWQRLKQARTPLYFAIIPLVYGFGCLYTQHPEQALQEWIRSLYWLAFPIVLFCSRQLTDSESQRLVNGFVGAVSLAAVVIGVKLLWPSRFHLDNFRDASLIDHIPYSYLLSFAIFLLVERLLFRKLTNVSTWRILGAGALVLFLSCILMMLKSFTGYFFFAGALLTCLIFAYQMYPKWRLAVGLGMALVFFVPTIYLWSCINRYYHVEEFQPETIEWKTPSGNPYEHDFQNKMKENGAYVHLFICHEELRKGWNQRSKIHYDSVWNGKDSIKWVIHRYMTSKGLRKDQVGLQQLTEKDIRNIELGMANVVYEQYATGIYPRVYETIWEVDQYLLTGDPNRKSFAQRIEMVRVAWSAICKSPWFGYGSGDAKATLAQEAVLIHSKMDPEAFQSAHNQYLAYLLKFGFVGTLIIIGVLFYPIFRHRAYRIRPLMVLFSGLLLANFGEGNFETFIGVNFFGLFYCLFLWNMADGAAQSEVAD